MVCLMMVITGTIPSFALNDVATEASVYVVDHDNNVVSTADTLVDTCEAYGEQNYLYVIEGYSDETFRVVMEEGYVPYTLGYANTSLNEDGSFSLKEYEANDAALGGIEEVFPDYSFDKSYTYSGIMVADEDAGIYYYFVFKANDVATEASVYVVDHNNDVVSTADTLVDTCENYGEQNYLYVIEGYSDETLRVVMAEGYVPYTLAYADTSLNEDGSFSLKEYEAGNSDIRDIETLFSNYSFDKSYIYSGIMVADEDTGIYYYFVFKTDNTVSKADKNKLQTIINAAPSSGYYTENDRYNGMLTSREGFWTDYQTALKKAEDINESSVSTQAEVDQATEKLEAAISRLIPTTQANTTALYEALELVKDAPETNTQYTKTSWNNFDDARAVAQKQMEKLFVDGVASEEYNTSNNQEEIDNAATVLTAAYRDLIGEGNLEENISLWKKAATWLLAQNQQVENGEYTEASATAWKNAYDALQEAMANGYDTQSRYDAYTSGVVALSSAYYGLEDSNPADITVHVRVADNFGAMFPEHAIADPKTATFDQNVTLSNGNKTISSLLSTMGYDDTPVKATTTTSDPANGWKQPVVMVYINGTLVVNRVGPGTISWSGYIGNCSYGKLNTSQLNFDAQLHEGDDIIIMRALGPGYSYYGVVNTGYLQYPYYFASLGMLSIQGDDVIEAEAGKAFSVNVEKTTAAAEAEKRTSAAQGVSLFVSEKQDTRDAAQSAPALTKLGDVTNSNGSASSTIYKEGWYRLAAVDVTEQTPGVGTNTGAITAGSFPKIAAGDYVLVHVLPSSDTAQVRADLQEELDQTFGAYPEAFYGDQWDTVKNLYEEATAQISGSELLGDAYDAKVGAVAQIEAIQIVINNANALVLSDVEWYLEHLPSKEEISAGAFTQGYKARVEGLKETYDSMSSYQRSLLNGMQKAQYEALMEAYGEDGSDLPAEVRGSVTVELVGDKDYTDKVTIGFCKSYKESATKSNEAEVTNPNAAFSQAKYGYMVMTPGSDAYRVLEGSDFWLAITSSSLYDQNTDKIDYEVYRIEVEGADAETVNVTQKNSTNKMTIWNGNVGNTCLVLGSASLTMPANDVTIKVYVRDKNADKSLEESKAIAKEALTEAYNSYKKADYTADGWTALTKEYNDGLAAIDAVGEQEATALDAAKDAAIAAMAAVKTRAEEQVAQPPQQDEPTVGTLGSVYVTVTNGTLRGTDADGTTIPSNMQGTFISETVPLNDNTTMMTAILTALQKNGYTWAGTGGTTSTGMDITYIASITNPDGYSLAEFTGGPKSGWMGTLNDWFTHLGFDQFSAGDGKLVDGDVIAVQYTCDLGEDIGGGWGNPDTSLASLHVNGGSLSDAFSKSQSNYTLTLNGSPVSINTTAANKNYQVRIYLNDKNATNYYRSGETLPVKAGDTIYVGVGGKGWPSMNSNPGYAISYEETWYEIKVVDSSSGAVVKDMIEAIGAINYSNYKTKADAVALARSAYDALNADAKKEVTNLQTLENAEKSISFYQQIDDVKEKLAALPKITNPTQAQANSYRSQINAATAAYNKLTEEQKQYITIADVENYNALAEALGMGTIVGSEEIPETEPPIITLVDENGETTAVAGKAEFDSKTGTLTITPAEGYKVKDVLINGVSKGASNIIKGLTDLTASDKITVVFEKQSEDLSEAEAARIKAGVENTTIKLWSTFSKKNNIQLNWTKSKGYKVDYYEVFKSTKRFSGFGTKAYYKTPTGTKNFYINTKELKKGTRYFYKVRGVRIINGEKVYTQWSNKAWRISRVNR